MLTYLLLGVVLVLVFFSLTLFNKETKDDKETTTLTSKPTKQQQPAAVAKPATKPAEKPAQQPQQAAAAAKKPETVAAKPATKAADKKPFVAPVAEVKKEAPAPVVVDAKKDDAKLFETPSYEMSEKAQRNMKFVEVKKKEQPKKKPAKKADDAAKENETPAEPATSAAPATTTEAPKDDKKASKKSDKPKKAENATPKDGVEGEKKAKKPKKADGETKTESPAPRPLAYASQEEFWASASEKPAKKADGEKTAKKERAPKQPRQPKEPKESKPAPAKLVEVPSGDKKSNKKERPLITVDQKAISNSSRGWNVVEQQQQEGGEVAEDFPKVGVAPVKKEKKQKKGSETTAEPVAQAPVPAAEN